MTDQTERTANGLSIPSRNDRLAALEAAQREFVRVWVTLNENVGDTPDDERRHEWNGELGELESGVKDVLRLVDGLRHIEMQALIEAEVVRERVEDLEYAAEADTGDTA